MLIGRILGINPNNTALAFAIEQLPDTVIGRAFTAALSRSAVLVLGLMILESQTGPLSGMLNLGIQLVNAIAPIIIACIGISIMLKTMFK